MPWLPELFSAPALQAVQDRRRREALITMPYFDGLLTGETEALIGSFAGEPVLYDPVRGRIRGARALADYAADMYAWLRAHEVVVEDVSRTIVGDRGCEEVLLRLGGGATALPYALVADHPGPGGALTEMRLYYAAPPRPPLLQPDPALAAVDGIAEHPCAITDDGRVCAVEHNVGTPPHAVLTVRASGGAVRRYGDL